MPNLPLSLTIQAWLLVLMCLAVAGHKFEILGFKIAFLGFAILVLSSLIVGLVALVLALIGKHSLATGFGALCIGLLPVGVVLMLVGAGLKVPAIHDISTDLAAPPEFTAAQALRKDGENSLDLPSEAVRKQQADFYTSLAPITVQAAPNLAFKKALSVAEQLGWQVHFTDSAKLRFEAVDETALFGFKDDIVVRVRATGQGSVIDVRSVSRVGESDLGANAKRIQAFVDAFKQ